MNRFQRQTSLKSKLISSRRKGGKQAWQRETTLTSNWSPFRDGVIKKNIHVLDINWKTEHPITRRIARRNNIQNEFLKQAPKKDMKFSSVFVVALIELHYIPYCWKLVKILMHLISVKHEIYPKMYTKKHSEAHHEFLLCNLKKRLRCFLNDVLLILAKLYGDGTKHSVNFHNNKTNRTLGSWTLP